MATYEARMHEVTALAVLLGPARGGPQVLQVWNTWFIPRRGLFAELFRLLELTRDGLSWRDQTAKWISMLVASRGVLKSLMFDEPEKQKMAKSVREACSKIYDEEANFFSSLEDVPIIEKLGRLVAQRAEMQLMQKQLDEKWTKILDLTDDFLEPQEGMIRQVSEEANKLLKLVSDSRASISIVANRVYDASKAAIERFGRWDEELDAEELITELRQAGAIIMMADASSIRGSIREILAQLNTFSEAAKLRAETASQGVRFYKGSLVNQGCVLRMFAEERRLAEAYVEQHGRETQGLEKEITSLRDLWLSAKLTPAQQKDAIEFMEQVSVFAAHIKAENVRIHNEFCQKYNGMFLEDVSDASSEKLVGVNRFSRLVGDRLEDVPEALQDTFERETELLREAIAERMEAFQDLIEDRVPNTLQSRLLQALTIHHQTVLEEVVDAFAKTLPGVTAVTGPDAFSMDGDLRRDTLVDVID